MKVNFLYQNTLKPKSKSINIVVKGVIGLWVWASNVISFDNAYCDIRQQLKIPRLEDDKADIRRLVKTRLSYKSTGKWLIIIDNADDFKIFYHNNNNNNSRSSALSKYLPLSTL